MPIEALHSIRLWDGKNVYVLKQAIDLARSSGYPFVRKALHDELQELLTLKLIFEPVIAPSGVECVATDVEGNRLFVDLTTMLARVEQAKSKDSSAAEPLAAE